LNPIDFIAASIVLVGLLVNINPLISVVAIGVSALRGTSTRLLKGIGFKKVEWAVVLCLFYWLASYFWSTGDFENLVSYDFLRNDGAMLISYSGLVFFLGWPLKVRECRAFWILFLTALSAVAFMGMAQVFNLPYSGIFAPLRLIGENRGEGGGGDIFVGWFKAHNTAGGVYAIAAVLALAFLQEAGLGWKERVFRWTLFMSCLGGLAQTYSRGAYFGFVVGAAVVFPLRKLRKNFRIAVSIAVPILLMVVMSNSLIARIDTISDPYYGNNADRIVLWKEALQDFADSPLIGMGYGRFNDVGLQYWGSKGIIWVAIRGRILNNDSHAHNSYLHFMAEGGIVGLWLTMFVWWAAYKELSFFTSHFPRSKLYWLERGAIGGLVVALVQALTEHAIGRGSVVLVLDALIGLTLAAARMEAKAAKASQPKASPSSGARLIPARTRRAPLPVPQA
jgi:O-antigen ligase